jgi:predicted cation transporter
MAIRRKNYCESKSNPVMIEKVKEVYVMSHIPAEPVLTTTVGLSAVAFMVLVLPFIIKKIEENLEPFFLVMGLISVTISGLWTWHVVLEALKAPVMIGSMPVGIFQVVLVVGLLIHFFNKPFCHLILKIAKTLGSRAFIFLLVAIFGLLSSVISVILTACLLSEIVAALPLSKKEKIQLIVIACFAAGMGACLTPLGEPLSTILVTKLAGPPYYAHFFFPLKVFGIYLIPGVIGLALFGTFWLGPKLSLEKEAEAAEYSETLRTILVRALKVYVFIAALVLIGEGFRPMMVWYFSKVAPGLLYWINMISAVLDNATLTAIEIGPAMALPQIIGIIMGLLISGGMLIPGNIPNIVSAGRLKISMKEWAVIGIPSGFLLLVVYFVILYVL